MTTPINREAANHIHVRDSIALWLVRCIVGLIGLAALGGMLVFVGITDLPNLEGVIRVIGTVFCFAGPLLGTVLGFYFRFPSS